MTNQKQQAVFGRCVSIKEASKSKHHQDNLKTNSKH